MGADLQLLAQTVDTHKLKPCQLMLVCFIMNVNPAQHCSSQRKEIVVYFALTVR
jgi:hypothetical protein